MSSWRILGGLPNILSSSRFVLAAGFAVVDSAGARVGLIGAAAATDFLDGWVARRSDSTSTWGALLDPLADRVFVLTAVGALLFTGLLTTGEYFVLLVRDLATAVGFLVARVIRSLRPVIFKARLTGKAVTVLQLVALATALLAPDLLRPLLVVVALVSLVSVADYTVALWRARQQ